MTDDELVERLRNDAEYLRDHTEYKRTADSLERAADRISQLTEQLKEARKCASCGTSLSADCPTCSRGWQS